MINRLLPCLCLGVLLVACDKQRNADKESSDPNSAAARASRAARQAQPGRQQDLRAALADAKKLTSPEERDKALAEVGRAAIELNPNIVAEVLRFMSPESTEKAALIKAMVSRLLETDPPAADEWVASLGSENDRAIGGGEIAVHLAASDPARAAELLTASGVTGREFDKAAAKVLRSWTMRTPADAVAWGLKLPPGESHNAAVKAVLSQWAQIDTKGAFDWLAQQNNAAVRKETSSTMAKALLDHPIGGLLLQQAEPTVRADLAQQMKELGGDSAIIPGGLPERPAPAPAVEPAPEPAVEPAPAPVVEPAVEPAAEPEPAMEPEGEMEPAEEDGDEPPMEDEEEESAE